MDIIEGELNFDQSNNFALYNQKPKIPINKQKKRMPNKSPIPIKADYKSKDIFSFNKLFNSNHKYIHHEKNYNQNMINNYFFVNNNSNQFSKTFSSFYKKNNNRSHTPILRTANNKPFINLPNNNKINAKIKRQSKSPILGKSFNFKRNGKIGIALANIRDDKKLKFSNNVINRGLKGDIHKEYFLNNNVNNINNINNNKNNEETIDQIDSRFIDMLPHLSPDATQKPSSLKEIFNARQLYISDAKLTPEYIRYVRPVNETEEIKYQKRYSENDTIIDSKIYDKRVDQLNYVDFCKICLDEQLINKTKIEYNNKPIISVVIPSYNKKNFLIKSVRSIQNQNFQNIEIIIVNDASTDNSTSVFNYLLESDPRIRIFHHMTNMGCWRTRLDGITYSRGDYIILFDAGDLYEDNYVLTDAYNIIQKYNLDSCKFLFRVIRSFNYVQYSRIFFHVGNHSKIIYEPENIKAIDIKIFTNWGNIWNRLVRANIYSKAFHLLNDLMLNIHKNVWDDLWFNHIVRRASYSYALYERVGYVYLQDGRGEGSPKSRSEEEKSKIVKEYVGFLYYDYIRRRLSIWMMKKKL